MTHRKPGTGDRKPESGMHFAMGNKRPPRFGTNGNHAKHGTHLSHASHGSHATDVREPRNQPTKKDALASVLFLKN